ncbi:MAG: sigma-54 dependent transcriptional regulator [Bacteroidales bacterium]
MAKGRILIVDDNKNIIRTLEILLGPEFEAVKGITDPKLLPTELRAAAYNLIILDMNFLAGINTGNEGLYWLNRIKQEHPDISVVLITAYGDVELAVKALKQGATDFVPKPWENSKLLATVKSAMQLNLSKKELGYLKQKEKGLKQELNREQTPILGSSPALLRVMNLVRKVARTDANVLITGENGSGKELIAREIHRQSARRDELLVPVDMGALPETLFESELFGHEKGAYTDAKEARAGKFETAHRGSLFLDEIGNLPVHLQAKLLAVLQNREIRRLGAVESIPVDIRLICATNKKLEEMVAEGLFREDLLYRINTIHIEVPPLRERGDDILVLADFYLKKYAARYEKHGLKIRQDAQEKLRHYPWPGNIRELRHTLEKAVILSENPVLGPDDFFLKAPVAAPLPGEALTLEEMEKRMIASAIGRNGGNLTRAAEALGITRQTMYNKVKKYGL